MYPEFLHFLSVCSRNLYQILVITRHPFSMKTKFNVAIQTSNKNEISAQSKDYISKEINEDCLSCGYNIVHPICPSCIAKGFKQWILRFPKDEQQLRIKVDHFLKAHRYFDGYSKKCASCGKNNTHLCPYCFTEYLYNIIKEAGLGIRALSEFLFIFNFDFEHKGYSQELEAYGGY